MRHLIAMGALLTLAQAPSLTAVAKRVPWCTWSPHSTSGWHEVSFLRFRMRVPRGVEPAQNSGFAHGGQLWSGTGIEVSYSFGYHDSRSLDGEDITVCRATRVDGRAALVGERPTNAGVAVMMWSADFRLGEQGLPSNMLVSASSSSREDLPTLRAIVLSVKR